MNKDLKNRIIRYQENKSLSKYMHIILGVLEAIDDKVLRVGDKLPSFNEVSKEIGYAGETTKKGYRELVSKGLVEAVNLKGYYVISTETKTIKKIALVLFSFQDWQRYFYDAFKKELGPEYQIDLFFHHNDLVNFEGIIGNIRSSGSYNTYAIFPMNHSQLNLILKGFEPERLVILDELIPIDFSDARVSSETLTSAFNWLESLKPQILKYEKLVVLSDENEEFPIGSLRVIEKFFSDHKIELEIRMKYCSSPSNKGSAYFTFSETQMWEILVDCQKNNYVVGKDIGIITPNESLLLDPKKNSSISILENYKILGTKSAKRIKKHLLPRSNSLFSGTQLYQTFKIIS